MRKLISSIGLFSVLCAGFLLLGACSGTSIVGKTKELLDQGAETAAPVFAETVILRCTTRSVEDRRKLKDRVNEEIKLKGSKARVTAFDCDGKDGPDS